VSTMRRAASAFGTSSAKISRSRGGMDFTP
jgi:hypothetical protein